MARIEPIELDQAPEDIKPKLEQMKQKMGGLPNIIRTMAKAPAVLNAYTSLKEALGGSSFSKAEQEQIAMAVSAHSGCGYCVSAHTAIGKGAGLDEDELKKAMSGEASDEKLAAALTFARTVAEKRGWVDDEDIQAVLDAGYDEKQVLELVALTILNLFTNYFNHVANTDIDFPNVEIPETAKA